MVMKRERERVDYRKINTQYYEFKKNLFLYKIMPFILIEKLKLNWLIVWYIK